MLNFIFEQYKEIPDYLYFKILDNQYITFFMDNTHLINLFEYLGVHSCYFDKIPNNIFLSNVANFLSEYKFIEKDDKRKCEEYIQESIGFSDFYQSLDQNSLYSINTEVKENSSNPEKILHNFKDLEDANLYKLPIRNNTKSVIKVHLYSKKMIVIEIKQHFYKVKKTTNMELSKDKIQYFEVIYKRANVKGRFSLVQNISEKEYEKKLEYYRYNSPNTYSLKIMNITEHEILFNLINTLTTEEKLNALIHNKLDNIEIKINATLLKIKEFQKDIKKKLPLLNIDVKELNFQEFNNFRLI